MTTVATSRPRRERWLPLLIGLSAFLVAVAAAYFARTAADTREQLQFERLAASVSDRVGQRVAAYVAILRAGAGLFTATGSVSRAQFHAFVSRLDIAADYPGVEGIGVSLRVAPEDRAALTAGMRGEGFAAFRIWPESERPEYHAIVYLEPLSRRNLAAIGYDMFTEPVRNAAMVRARDGGMPAATARVTLVQEIEVYKQAGFLIYVPIYRGGSVPATEAGRRDALVGFVYSPFRVEDLVREIAGEAVPHLSVYDSATADPARLLYRGEGERGVRTSVRTIAVAGRPWTLELTAPPGQFVVTPRLVPGVLTGGLVLALALVVVTRSLQDSRHAAQRLAEEREGAVASERRARREAEALAGISRALNQMLAPERQGELIVRSARALTGLMTCVLYRQEPPGDLTVVAVDGAAGPALRPGLRIPAGTGTVGRALTEQRSVSTPDFTRDPAILVTPALLAVVGEAPYRSVLATPLVAHGRNIGALALGDQTGRTFSEAEVRLVETLAAQAAVALENARLFQDAEAARVTAEEANRAKDEFLATVSHELRTPLNAILGWSRMLATGHLDAGTRERALAALQRNAVAQAQLVDDLLDMSRITAGKLRLDIRVADLAPVVEAALDVVRPAAAAKGVNLHAAIDPHPGPVSGDPDRLQQIVWNLLTNAIKFTPPGGHVRLALRRAGPHVEVEVSDTGRGISAELLPLLFERFRQADSSSTRAHGGLGIGLALVRHLTELHGGTVHAASPGPGQGATFTVALPLRTSPPHPGPGAGSRAAGAAAAAPAGGPDPVPVPALAGLRVLVVDDDRDALELLGQMLAQAGAEVEAASSVRAAVEAMSRARPDVVVSDIEMPGEDGYALIARIRARASDGDDVIPAVAVTAYGRIEDRIRSLAAGYQQHLSKPVEPTELVAVVGRLAGRAPG